MKNYIAILLILGFSILSTTNQLKAQISPQPYAGGEINIEYDDAVLLDEDCLPSDFKRFRITVRLYRDCVPTPWDDDFPLILRNKPPGIQGQPPADDIFSEITMDYVTGIPPLDNKCIAGQPVCTEGAIYQSGVVVIAGYDFDPVDLKPDGAPKFQLIYGELNNNGVPVAVADNSPLNVNLQLGQKFNLITEFTNMVQRCGAVSGNAPSTNLPIERIANGYDNTPARWLTPDPLETFCDGIDYKFRLRVLDEDTTRLIRDLNGNPDDIMVITDSLSYRMVRPYSVPLPLTYIQDFSPTAPFPTAGPILFDEKEGVLTFKPELLPNEQTFIAAVAFEVTEWRKIAEVDGGGFVRMVPRPINITRRQMRFVIDKSCRNRLPDFESVDGNFNVTEQAWEYDCSTKEMIWHMTEPMLAVDLVDNTFRLFRGTAAFPTEPTKPFKLTATPLNVNKAGEFTDFKIELSRPIGPGRYTMFAKKSEKGTTLNNLCGFELPEEEDIPIYVNTASEYDFPSDLVRLCYPADFPTDKGAKLDVFRGQSDFKKSKYAFSTWRFTRDPVTDKVQVDKPTTRYNMELERDINGDLIFPGGVGETGGDFWEVEYAEDFSWTDYKGDKIDAFCIASDEVFIQFFEGADFDVPDFDLCPREPWPVIDLTDMVTNDGVIDFRWTFFDESKGRAINDPKAWDTINGSSDTTSQILSRKNSVFPVASIAFGLNNDYIFTVQTVFPNGCKPVDTFKISRSEVFVDIVPGNDTTICPGQQFELENIESRSYFTPEFMTTQWYLNGVEIAGATDSVLTITEQGMYKVIVTKLSSGGNTCTEEDSVFVRIADIIPPPTPFCADVRWNTEIDSIEQMFTTPAVFGAEDYQVRETDFEGNVTNWKALSDGLDHKTIGSQIRVETRGVNLEVPENAICRFGPASELAEACNVAVKPLNVFTPNGDGINDFMFFDLLQAFPGSSLKIFNRWGRMVYESADYRNDWDGEDHKDGTYYYVLDINDESQGILTGVVTIIR